MSVTVANEGCNQVGERVIGILLLGRVNTGYDVSDLEFVDDPAPPELVLAYEAREQVTL